MNCPQGSDAGSVRIRDVLRPGDLGAIVELHGRLYAREYGFDETFEAYVAGPLAEFVKTAPRPGRVWVAEVSGSVVGCIAMVRASEREAQLRWFLVDPSVRGAGLGRRLMELAIGYARAERYARVILWTVSDLEAAGRLYRSAGFMKIQEQPGQLWGTEVVEEKYLLELGANEQR